ncbi:MAG TPA: hypothetical protein H9961_04385 [Candidatus Duodenibacillus intestinavium]|nr:hypothetical protein [Candidatus Duodenibacillus intestinavium]
MRITRFATIGVNYQHASPAVLVSGGLVHTDGANMSEQPKLKSIPLCDAIKYFTGKNITCDVCGNRNWEIFTNQDDSVTQSQSCRIIESSQGFSIEIGGTNPVFQMQCSRCGQIKVFSALLVAKNIANSYEESNANISTSDI